MKNLGIALLFALCSVMPMCGKNNVKKASNRTATETTQVRDAIVETHAGQQGAEGARQGVNGAVPSAETADVQESAGARITFEKTKFDFGTFEFRGAPRSVDFAFTNTGDEPLVILRTELSCTCLSVEYPRKPVAPGQSGIVKVTYTPKKETGKFQNTVKVITNASIKSHTLFVDCEVVKK